MVFQYLLFCFGLIILISGAELLVRYASKLAVRFEIPKVVVGLTIVAFGTSAPELAVGIKSGLAGKPDLMLGNIIGSNITNILLILGVSALISPLAIQSKLVRFDVPIMIGCTLLLFLFLLNGVIGFWECLIFLILLALYILFLIRQQVILPPEKNSVRRDSRPAVLFSIVLILAGLAGLIAGANITVNSAVIIAEHFGVSELIIGLTVVAIGTSLPEIVTAIVAALKSEADIAVGNIVGSNIFNILVVLGISGLFVSGGISVSPAITEFDMPILFMASLACLPVFFSGYIISRSEGTVFLLLYAGYLSFLILNSTGHEMAGLIGKTLLYFVLPFILITVSIIALKAKNSISA